MYRKIVADSSANLYETDCADFASVPLKIIFNEKEYVDDANLDVAAMIRELRSYKGKSGTSCPSMGDWLAAFGDADEVFGVALTSHISGGYNAARIAAEEYTFDYPDRKVFILNSLTTGPELELIVEKYSELIHTDRSFESICEEIQNYAKHTHLMFSLESLVNFARNGRVNLAVAKAASLLDICIVGRASDEGELEPLHKCLGEKRALDQLYAGILEAGYAGGKVRIRHSDNLEAAEIFAAKIRKNFPNSDIKIGENRGLCSYYAEKGGLLVGFEG